MDKIVKTACILAAVLFVAVTVGSVAEQDVYAGGGIDYKVTVRNPTDSRCAVNVYVNQIVNTPLGSSSTIIQPHTTVIFRTGSLCPSGLRGSYWDADSGVWRKMKDTHCLGYAISYHGFTACCWDVNFYVCRKTGSPGSAIQDKDYGFCKE